MTPIARNASQWALYAEMEGAETVACELNAKFNALAEKGTGRRQFEHEMRTLMERYAKFGAVDGEPMRVMSALVERHIEERDNTVSFGPSL